MLKDDVVQFIIKYLNEEVKIERTITLADNLQEIGLDSLDIVSLLFAVEEKYGVKISDEDLVEKELFVISKMADYICSVKTK